MTRNSPINGHVSVIGSVSDPKFEALFVNRDGHNKPHYDHLYESVMRRFEAPPLRRAFEALDRAFKGEPKQSPTERFVKSVFDEIRQTVRYSDEDSTKVAKVIANWRREPFDGALIENMDVIKSGYGVCSHMALAAAAITEQAIMEGKIEGTINYHRAHITKHDGHAWARLTDNEGKRWIIDVAGNYFGLLENAPKPEQYLTDQERTALKYGNLQANNSATKSLSIVFDEQPNGSWRVADEVRDPSQRFRSSELGPQSQHSAFIVYTDSRPIFVGYDNQTHSAYTLKQQDFWKGNAGKQPIRRGGVEFRVGQPLPDPGQPGTVQKIVAIKNEFVFSVAEIGVTVRDASLEDFLGEVRSTLAKEVHSLGMNDGPGDRHRVAHVYAQAGTKVDIATATRYGTKAWLHTSSGNVYQVEPTDDGRYKITDFNRSVRSGKPFQSTVARLDDAVVGDRFKYGSVASSTIEKVVAEYPGTYDAKTARELPGFAVEEVQSARVEAQLATLEQSTAVTMPLQHRRNIQRGGIEF